MTFGVLMLVPACSVGPDYTAPAPDYGDAWFSGLTEETIRQDPVITNWWEIFKDPLLDKYIDEAVNHNKDLDIALANVRAARAVRSEASAAFWPDLGFDPSFERSRSPGDGPDRVGSSFDAQFDASWEIDVFGGNRRAQDAADARYESEISGYYGALLATLSEVARNYFEARGLQKQIAITEENAGLLKKTYDLVMDRREAGESSEFDVSRAEGEYQLILARIPDLRAGLRERIYTLSILLGQPPEYLLEEMLQSKPLPAPPDVVPVGLRSDLLRRRPDVREAERELAASTSDIGVAVAELFPKFSITGAYGSGASVFGDLFTGAAKAWSFGLPITWSLFEGGANQARIKIEEAEAQAALASYERTVLTALKDAETALTRYGESLETRRRLERAVLTRRRSVQFASELFRAGEEDFLSVIDSERELVSAEDQLVVIQTQNITNLIALYTTLGGGWEIGAQRLEAEKAAAPE
jgi:multidrug efflux system outer membrane protein